MPLTTYVANEVLTAASLNNNFTFAAANPTSGLVRVGGGTLSGASTSFASVFSATYEAYKIVLSNVAPSASTNYLAMTLGATVTGYYWAWNRTDIVTGTMSGDASGGTSASFNDLAQGVTFGLTIEMQNPFIAAKTAMQMSSATYNTTGTQKVLTGAGFLDNVTSYTAFTLSIAAGTMTGTVNVYGYALS